jgi:hypothetical protein
MLQVGSGHVRFIPIRAAGDDAVLVLSGASSLLIYSYGGRTYEHTLAYHRPIDLATPFFTREVGMQPRAGMYAGLVVWTVGIRIPM